jgi:hypothetical protein
VRRSLAASLNSRDQQRLTTPPPAWLDLALGQWRALDYRWQLWVMDFDRQRQRELLGDNRWQGLIGLAAVAAALGLALWPLVSQRQRAQQGDLAWRQLQGLLHLLELHGHGLHSGETLPSFCSRVSQAQPKLAEHLCALSERYCSWRFGQASDTEALPALLWTIAQCKAQVKVNFRGGAAHDHRPTI